ncbi:carboxypeptidase-like regulatory domain-containing protein [Nostoc ellipsosporum NOK]|jgi:hypothetical protein|nr:carboxypeptidase-like regulatory domain-containing protein [Nostoc ellipsosporum NOK]
MKQTRIFFSLLFCLLAGSVSAQQFTVSGTIIDSATREPLSAASVFCQNTTIGTTTNREGQFSLQLRSGGYELIITYTGYRTRLIRISQSDNVLPPIEMVKEDRSMSEVVIKSSNEVPDGWEKYGKFFFEQFVGSTPNAALCTLENPDVLKFYFLKKSNKLRVLATEPLKITNTALGYKLTYALDSFVYYYNTDISLYRGYCLFSPMDSSFSMMKTWSANRSKAYAGSKLHFMRSYYDSTLQQEGFRIGMLDDKNNTLFNPIANVYDTVYYGAVDSTGSEIEIWFPRKISVTYDRRPEPEYLARFKLPKDVPVQISYVDIQNWIAIKENGYYYDQRDWINQGYWSWKNIGDLLPYDYIP